MAIHYGRIDVMGDSKFGDEFKEEARTREMSDREWLKDASERILGIASRFFLSSLPSAI